MNPIRDEWRSDDGSVRLILGDCLEVLPTLRGACAGIVYTDPPFAAAGGSTNGMVLDTDVQFFEHWFDDVASKLRRCCGPASCWFVHCDWRTIGVVARSVLKAGRNFRSEAFRVSQALYWARGHIGMGSPFRNAVEMIAFVRGPRFAEPTDRTVSTLIEQYWPYGAKEFHGAQKPPELAERLMDFVDPPRSYLCLDPFMGSGSTAVACVRGGRYFIGMEMEAEHFETAKHRVLREFERAAKPRQLKLLDAGDVSVSVDCPG